ncbi:MAG: TetR/AcrR family transcriptional regulator [Clostridia bacterium]|nr:TetR/AcrR family transcriptional regulator [Clostridia bacterium]
MDGFQRRQQQKMNDIYRAALKLFSKHGVKKVKITDIAHEAQVSPVTIYNYYGSKTALLRQVVTNYLKEQYQKYELLLQQNIPFPEKIESIIFNKKETAKTLHPEFLRSVMSKDPQTRTFVEEFYQKKAIPMLMEILKEGLEQGYINPEISTRTIMFYINMFWETVYRSDILDDENRCIQMELSTVFFYGLMGKKPE